MALRDLSMLKGALSPADRAAADRLGATARVKATLDRGRQHPGPLHRQRLRALDVHAHRRAQHLGGRLAGLLRRRLPQAASPTSARAATTRPTSTSTISSPASTATARSTTTPSSPARAATTSRPTAWSTTTTPASRGHTPIENLQVTVAHEYFHAIQFAYDYFEDGWCMEATAAWVEDEVYDEVNDNVQYLADSPLTAARAARWTSSAASTTTATGSSSATSPRRFPKETAMLPEIVLDIWKARRRLERRQQDNVLHAGARRRARQRHVRSPFDKVFAKFAAANRRPTRSTTRAPPRATRRRRSRAARRSRRARPQDVHRTKLDHLDQRHLRFTREERQEASRIASRGPPTGRAAPARSASHPTRPARSQQVASSSNSARRTGRVRFG